MFRCKYFVLLIICVSFTGLLSNPCKGNSTAYKPVLIMIGESTQAENLALGITNQTSLTIYIETLTVSLESYLSSLDANKYSKIVFLLNDATLISNGTSLDSLSSSITNGLMVVFQTAQLWKISDTSILGLEPVNRTSSAEWNGQTTVEVLNTTYLPSYNLHDSVTLRGHSTLVSNISTATTPLIDVTSVQLLSQDQHIGIFEHKVGLGCVITLNMILNQGQNAGLTTMIKELLAEIIYNPSDVPIESTTPTSTVTSPPDNNFFDLESYIALGSILLPFGILTLLSLAGLKVINSFRPKNLSSIDQVADSTSSSILETELSSKTMVDTVTPLTSTLPSQSLKNDESRSDFTLLGLLIAPLLWFLHLFLAPKLRKLGEDELLDNPTRQQILLILEQNAFEHFREIKRLTKAGIGSLTWHLQVLADFEVIALMKYGQFQIYYLPEKPPTQKELMVYFALRTDIAQQIIRVFLNGKTHWTIDELSKQLGITSDKIFYHCTRFSQLKLVFMEEKVYSLNSLHKSEIVNTLEHFSWNKIYLRDNF